MVGSGVWAHSRRIMDVGGSMWTSLARIKEFQLVASRWNGKKLEIGLKSTRNYEKRSSPKLFCLKIQVFRERGSVTRHRLPSHFVFLSVSIHHLHPHLSLLTEKSKWRRRLYRERWSARRRRMRKCPDEYLRSRSASTSTSSRKSCRVSLRHAYPFPSSSASFHLLNFYGPLSTSLPKWVKRGSLPGLLTASRRRNNQILGDSTSHHYFLSLLVCVSSGPLGSTHFAIHVIIWA